MAKCDHDIYCISKADEGKYSSTYGSTHLTLNERDFEFLKEGSVICVDDGEYTHFIDFESLENPECNPISDLYKVVEAIEATASKKRIEEMAKDLQDTHDYEDCEAWHCGGCEYEKYGKNYFCSSIKQAEKMTERGYRKINDDHQKQVACYALGCQEGDKIARRVAAEIFAEIERFMLDGAIGGKYPTKLINPDKYAELKKKYIGKDTNVTTKDTGEGK